MDMQSQEPKVADMQIAAQSISTLIGQADVSASTSILSASKEECPLCGEVGPIVLCEDNGLHFKHCVSCTSTFAGVEEMRLSKNNG